MVSSQRGKCCRTYGQLMSFSRIMDGYARHVLFETARAIFFNASVAQRDQTRTALGHVNVVRDDQDRGT